PLDERAGPAWSHSGARPVSRRVSHLGHDAAGLRGDRAGRAHHYLCTDGPRTALSARLDRAGSLDSVRGDGSRLLATTCVHAFPNDGGRTAALGHLDWLFCRLRDGVGGASPHGAARQGDGSADNVSVLVGPDRAGVLRDGDELLGTLLLLRR